MCKDGTRVRKTRFGASTRWLVYLGLFIAFWMGGHAGASVITDSFIGFPPDPFLQQDKTWGDWTDVISNVPTSSASRGFASIPLRSSMLLEAADTTKAGSGISGFSNSFLEQLPVPEPTAMALFGTGVLALAAVMRRRISKS